MDALSAEMFGNAPAVRVSGFQEHRKEIRAATQAILGRSLRPGDMARLVAAPNGSEVYVTARQDGDEIELQLGYQWFDGAHDHRFFVDAETEKRIAYFADVAVKPEAPHHLETRLFARQVSNFRQFGIDQIWLYAEGYPHHPAGIIGYYVWARLGFVMDLGGLGRQLIEAGYTDVESTLDLFEKEGGAEWWYNHGSGRDAVFYLYEGSPCVSALETYLIAGGLDVNA